MIVEACVVLVPFVFTGKFTLAAPTGMVTVAATLAHALLLLFRETTAAEAAVPVSDTVPVDMLPPTTEVGLSTTELTPGVTEKLVDCVTPL